jgi:hypothetical protein
MREQEENKRTAIPSGTGPRADDSLVERAAFSPPTDFELAGNSQLSAGADMLRLRRPFDGLVVEMYGGLGSTEARMFSRSLIQGKKCIRV